MKTWILAALLLVAGTTLNAQNKMGYINSLELLSVMPDVKKADSTLQLLANELQQQYVTYLGEYQALVNDYNANASAWGEVKKEYAEKDIQDLQKRITDFESSSQQKVELRKEELYAPILEKANAAIGKVGKDQKLTGVIDTSTGALIYTGDDMVNILPLVKKELGI